MSSSTPFSLFALMKFLTPRRFTQIPLAKNACSQKRLISLEDLLLSLIFRHGSILKEEISFFFQNRQTPSKQALIKRELLLNYDVWPLVNSHFCQNFYNNVFFDHIYKSYLVIAVDGSTACLSFHPALSKIFGEAILTGRIAQKKKYKPLFLELVLSMTLLIKLF